MTGGGSLSRQERFKKLHDKRERTSSDVDKKRRQPTNCVTNNAEDGVPGIRLKDIQGKTS